MLGKKSKHGFRYQLFTFYWTYLIFLICVIIITIVFFWALFKKADYNSDNIPFGGSSQSGNIGAVNYNYYLDMTPTMFGFAEAENSSFQMFANVLESINLDRVVSAGEISCYIQSADITQVEMNSFYGYFKGSGIRNGYTQYINQSDEEALSDKIDTYMSAVFSGAGSTGGLYVSDRDNVSILITDLNFMQDDNPFDEEKLTAFSRALSRATLKSNISVYCIESSFNGLLIDMPYDELEDGANTGVYPFYCIIASENDAAYENFTDLFKKEMEQRAVSYTDEFEIKRRVLGQEENLQLDYEWIKQEALLFNLNYDNKSWKELPENAMGLSIIEKGEAATISLPIMETKPSGYYDNSEQTEADNLQEIECRVIVSYPDGRGYTEYQEEKVVRIASASIQEMEGEHRLLLKMELLPSIEILDSKEKYIVIDIAMYMQNPKYKIPDWGSEEESPMRILLAQIVRDKKENYDNIMDDYDKFIGNVILYVSYP